MCTDLIPSRFDLIAFLDEITSKYQSRASAKGLSLQLHCAQDVPPIIHTDQEKLQQVLSNLLDNAVQFTKIGEIALRLSIQDGELLQFDVEDTGIGIIPEDTDRIFKPFIQSESGPQLGEGNGLGLAICKHLVHKLGGEISVFSHWGWGSTFRFHIPLSLEEFEPKKTHNTYKRVIGLTTNPQKYRLLIVDDKADKRARLMNNLKPLGFQLREVDNGPQAIDLFKSWQPDLIWMDLRMPKMDGCETTRLIRSLGPEGQKVIILGVTASTLDRTNQYLMAFGCNDFIRKPIAPQAIYEALTLHLGIEFIYQDIYRLNAVS